MKKLLILFGILIPVLTYGNTTETAPQDTTIYVGSRKFVVKENEGKIKVKVYEEVSSGDTIQNDQIFEGIYMDGQSTERRTALSVPFMKKDKKKSFWFEPHVGGIYIGYNRLADGMFFGGTDEVDLVASKSWEWGINLFEGSLKLSRNWALTGGLGFGYTSYRIDGKKGFYRVDGKSVLMDAPEDVHFSNSRLRYYHFRLPVSVEWQEKFGHKGPLFVSLGIEPEVRTWVRSKAKLDGRKHTLANDLNVHPVGLNLLAQAGYSDWGFYCRYSTFSLFENNKGPDITPFSFGVCWYW